MPFNADQDAFQALRDIVAENTMGIVAWVGAGLSAEARLPTWRQLKLHLVETLRRKANALEDEDRRRLRIEADSIEVLDDFWLAFGRLRKALGETSYRDEIRAQFATAASTPIPQAYKTLWRLRLSGLVSLNIDRLATRAFTTEHSGAAPQEFSGHDVARLSRALGSTQAFIANLHGTVDDHGSWVFTHEELRKLTESQGYKSVMSTLLMTRTVLFVGVGIQDVAISRHLQGLREEGLGEGTHFWLTSKQDTRTDRWAEALGVRIIRYEAKGDDHSELQEALRDLATYKPKDDDAAPPVALSTNEPAEPLPPPAELALMPAQDIRSLLNAHARTILATPSPDAYKRFAAFCDDYDEAIYRAWYISTEPGKNELLGYQLEKVEARGAFGRVYYAVSPDGRPAAVKVLHEEIRSIPERLQSFRRGVRSMEILGERAVEGMVTYEAASEIPAFVAMEWIQGPNLKQAVEQQVVKDWTDVLRISQDLATIIRRAHSLPERVLHRDIRPTNVMLKDYWVDPEEWELVVLDFDLSWHMDAPEKSVYHSTSNGYLAPEQLRPVAGASTRSSLVDSFGLATTFFFLCSGRDPAPGEHIHPDWPSRVEEAASLVAEAGWRSLPKRFARMIMGGSDDEQSRRWDVGQMVAEIERLSAAHLSAGDVKSAELVCEELAARSQVLRGYNWDPDHLRAWLESPSGLTVSLDAVEAKGVVELDVRWESRGVHDRASTRKYVGRNLPAAEAALKRGPWQGVTGRDAGESLYLQAEFSSETQAASLDAAAEALDTAVEPLRFDTPD